MSANAFTSVRRRFRLALVGAAFVCALVGCQPVRPKLFDEAALNFARSALVLPLADAPGRDSLGSGAAARGVIVDNLLNVCEFDIVNLSDKKLHAALKETGLSIEDCYDPAVAAELAVKFDADIAVTGQLLHYAIQQKMATTTVLIIAGGGTEITHWVSVSIRIVDADTGKIIYTGHGTAQNAEGFTAAAEMATEQAFAALAHFRKQNR